VFEAWWLSLAFLGIGVLIGFLAQRSRMCFVAGFRDWLLVGDTELLLGLLSFLATVWLLSSLGYALGFLHRGMPEYGAVEVRTVVAGQGAGVLQHLRLANLRELRVLGAAQAAVPLASVANRFLYASLAGGWLIGLVSVLAGGCVLRQHVLAAQGSRNAWLFLAGFYAAVPLYYLLLGRFLGWVYR
jgi:uncharacterized membrane protein YedE/YeeE